MYTIKGELDASGIYLDEEIERFCSVYFKPKQRQSAQDHQSMNALAEDQRGLDLAPGGQGAGSGWADRSRLGSRARRSGAALAAHSPNRRCSGPAAPRR